MNLFESVFWQEKFSKLIWILVFTKKQSGQRQSHLKLCFDMKIHLKLIWFFVFTKQGNLVNVCQLLFRFFQIKFWKFAFKRKNPADSFAIIFLCENSFEILFWHEKTFEIMFWSEKSFEIMFWLENSFEFLLWY